MRSSVSIVLFFLLSGLFLTLLLGLIEHSRKLLALSGAFLAAVVCIIVILEPVQLPNLAWWRDNEEEQVEAASTSTTSSVMAVPTTTSVMATSTTLQEHTVITSEPVATTEYPVDGRY